MSAEETEAAQPTTTDASVESEPYRMSEFERAGLESASVDDLRKMREALDAVIEEKAPASTVATPPLTPPKVAAEPDAAEKVESPAPAAPSAWKPEPVPAGYGVHPVMKRMAPMYFLWTLEAIEATAVRHEYERDKFRTIYRPLDGLLIRRIGQKGEPGNPVVEYFALEPTVVSTPSGRLVECKKGSRVWVACNFHLRVVIPMLDEDGAAHHTITPTGFERLCDGTSEPTFDVVVEPDLGSSRGIRLYPLATVLGE